MPLQRAQFDAIGTRWFLDLPDHLPEALRNEALRRVLARIAVFDKHYSRFREDSLVTRMAHQTGAYELPPDAEPMMSLYEELYRLTEGAFTPIIGKTLVEAGYDASYSLKPGALSPVSSWSEAMTYQPPILTLHQPVLLDFGAAGKGYLIDIVAGILRDLGITQFCIDAGGDLLCTSEEKPFRIGLEHPLNTSQAIGVVEISSGSICGSSGNRRTWGEFHHTIDPRTLQSPRHILATWVIAPHALLADALATCLFLSPAEKLHMRYDFAHCILFPDMTIDTSPNFPAEFFYAVH